MKGIACVKEPRQFELTVGLSAGLRPKAQQRIRALKSLTDPSLNSPQSVYANLMIPDTKI